MDDDESAIESQAIRGTGAGRPRCSRVSPDAFPNSPLDDAPDRESASTTSVVSRKSERKPEIGDGWSFKRWRHGIWRAGSADREPEAVRRLRPRYITACCNIRSVERSRRVPSTRKSCCSRVTWMSKRHFASNSRSLSLKPRSTSCATCSDGRRHLEEIDCLSNKSLQLTKDIYSSLAGRSRRSPGIPSASHAGLRQRDLHRLPGAARRPAPRGTTWVHRRWPGFTNGCLHGRRSPEGL